MDASTNVPIVKKSGDDDRLRWLGLCAVYDEIEKAATPNKKGGINGWVAEALLLGVPETVDRITNTLNTLSIISGLLVSITMPFIYNAPLGIQNKGAPSSFWTIAFYVTLELSVLMYGLVIMLGCSFGAACGASPRDADRLRLLLKGHMVPSYSAAAFALGNTCTFTAAAIVLYRQTELGYGLSLLIGFFVYAAVIGIMNQTFVAQGHIVHGWLKYHNEDFTISMRDCLRQYKERADRDAEFRRQNGLEAQTSAFNKTKGYKMRDAFNALRKRKTRVADAGQLQEQGSNRLVQAAPSSARVEDANLTGQVQQHDTEIQAVAEAETAEERHQHTATRVQPVLE